MVIWLPLLISSSARSFMALMLCQDSSAGDPSPRLAASMTFRWIPLDQKSLPPARTITRTGRVFAQARASRRRRHCVVDMAPL